jgi:hypothetical protein
MVLRGIFVLSLTLVTLVLYQGVGDICELVYAHNFTPNPLSTFLYLAYKGETELSLAVSNYPSNVSLVLDHSKEAIKVLNKAYYRDDFTVYDFDFDRRYNEAQNSQNSSVHALALADMVDEILVKYVEAYALDVDVRSIGNMTFNNKSKLISPSFSEMTTNMSNTHLGNKGSDGSPIQNLAPYQSAQQLSEKTYQIFKNKLQTQGYQNTLNTQKNVELGLEKNLLTLRSLVEKKAPLADLLMTVHGHIHPNLQVGYNLLLRQ